MTDAERMPSAGDAAIFLVARRLIYAPAHFLFAAWTRPEHLVRWWGPRQVTCVAAEMDLRVGGAYRLGNQFPDGRVSWISGTFEEIEPPYRLRYTWTLNDDPRPAERVTVRFEPRGAATEVIVVHEGIPTPAMRDGHAEGWLGCLEGLEHLAELWHPALC